MVAGDVHAWIKREQRLVPALVCLVLHGEYEILIGHHNVIGRWSIQDYLLFKIGTTTATKLLYCPLNSLEVLQKCIVCNLSNGESTRNMIMRVSKQGDR